jgi:hypothetical protein
MKSPWKWSTSLERDREYLVLASSIPPESRRSTWRLFRGASAVRKQLAVTDGVIGFSLLARPLRKQYATLSVWTGEDALARFAGPTRTVTSYANSLPRWGRRSSCDGRFGERTAGHRGPSRSDA